MTYDTFMYNNVAFDKLDGSSFRAKWTPKQSFSVFGTRTQLIDETTSFWGEMPRIFKKTHAELLDALLRQTFHNEREITLFGEFLGVSSFAGNHNPAEPHRIVIFDALIGHKNHYFLKPKEFIKLFSPVVEIPRVVYEGNLNDSFIADVRANKFNLSEGVVCKGLVTNGAYMGKVWMCKIKTQAYIDRLKQTFGNEWEKYGE